MHQFFRMLNHAGIYALQSKLAALVLTEKLHGLPINSILQNPNSCNIGLFCNNKWIFMVRSHILYIKGENSMEICLEFTKCFADFLS